MSWFQVVMVMQKNGSTRSKVILEIPDFYDILIFDFCGILDPNSEYEQQTKVFENVLFTMLLVYHLLLFSLLYPEYSWRWVN